MTKRIDEVNMDNNKVGWYQVSFQSDSFVAYSIFEKHKDFQVSGICSL